MTSTKKATLLHPAYFGSIAQFVAIANADQILFEDQDNYQKQTYRNRTYIYGANGRLLLTIPIKHSQDNRRQLYRDIRIENDFEWQKLHWRSLETAYRTSPFFEFYEDDLAPLFEKKKEFLLDFNYETLEVVADCLQLDLSYQKTNRYKKEVTEHRDLRSLIIAKNEKHELASYNQVFQDKHGSLKNLSILDLIFNEGTNALTYLEEQSIAL
ncbi:WbqC family protein [Aquimarina intermedia]|uniref:WbqC-like protein n=1 Tax=Aquimarina intermedia TaxID=350814 RepID=A0A5S5C0N3_9FLAO|nr:WbqC family protein [Aquimarina intermedia]TYP72847.1 WbqC-like protein [Aquimarina intermedia]